VAAKIRNGWLITIHSSASDEDRGFGCIRIQEVPGILLIMECKHSLI
jgi:hypothetical protein